MIEEPGTVAWFAIRFGPSTFGVYDVFPDDAARDAHLAGGVGQPLGPNTGVLFSEPQIEKIDVIAENSRGNGQLPAENPSLEARREARARCSAIPLPKSRRFAVAPFARCRLRG